MSKCDSYYLQPEQHYFVDKYGAPVYENINVPRCWGTKEKDVCDCDGDRSKCSFYKSVREKAAEEEKNFSTTKNVLKEIEDLIDEYWGTDPIYYIGSLNPHETEVAKLCCKINEIINNVTETKQSETKTEEKPKKKVYAIFYEQFFFGKHYDRYVQLIETEDIFHEVGVLIYKASTAVRNIRWCELHDVSVEAAIARYMSEYSEDWKRIDRTDILRFIEK